MPVDFLNDLGIIPNKGTENEHNNNLLQGQKYKDYARTYLDIAKPHLVNLEQTYMPHTNITDITNMNYPFKKKQVSFKDTTNSIKKTTMDALNKKKLSLLRQKKRMNEISSSSFDDSKSDYYLYIFLMAFFCILLFLILKQFVSIVSCNHILLVIVLIIVFIFTASFIDFKK